VLWKKKFKSGFEEGGEENLIFSCSLSLNHYQSEVNMLQVINSFNFMFDEKLCKICLCENVGL
jgi:hypothetical protein